MGVTVSSPHVSAVPSSSGGRLLTLFPGSSVRSLSRETVLHKLLQHESFPQTASAWVPFTGCSPSGTGCSSMGPHGVTSPASKPALVWTSFSTAPQVLEGACSSMGSPRGHSLLQAFTCSSVMSLPWAIGGYLLHRGPPWTTGEQPASLWSSSRAAREDSLLWRLEHLLPPPSSLILVSAELFLSHGLAPLS